ncbi:MAG: class I SAM-dependent methyltransferase family protein [Nitrospirae bacterium]|nr:class I SAM-dependent methyltransferase family protein [Nitrospirota bacterium]MBF0536549.1 class I SAM-dependent methyltransferase family protein [Nitrospirota bacterium]MBF0618478.1 class I SAM-dependent methyltransferase family protein [Nitrospirota bacterium]
MNNKNISEQYSNNIIPFFEILNEEDIRWIIDNGVEKIIGADNVIIDKSEEKSSLFVLIDGFVEAAHDTKKRLSVLGPGNFLGMNSYLIKTRPLLVFKAINEVTILELSADMLKQKIDSDPRFALRLYRALSISLVIRYNKSIEYINHISPEVVDNIAGNETMQKIIPILDEFKKLILKADKEAKQSGNISDETTDKVLCLSRSFSYEFYNQICSNNTLSTELKEVIGYRCQQEFLPYILLTNAANAMYSKPRGYAGDYLTIKMIYDNIPEGKSAVGVLIDTCFLEEPAAKAVRNRKNIIINEVRHLLENNSESNISITSLACGPAEEIFDIYTSLERTGKLKITLLDFDIQALAFVAEKLEKLKLNKNVTLLHQNLIYLLTKKEILQIKTQDLIYSIGLIDYFNDSFVVRLFNMIYGYLKPGGKIMIGNFHPRNTSRGYMDYILEWKLIYRTEEDMNRLFLESLFKRECTNIQFEEEGINLFAECIKE